VGCRHKEILGLTGAAIETATIVAGLAYAVSQRTVVPTAFLIKGVPHEPTQRLKMEAL
jgi:hypothetical protein